MNERTKFLLNLAYALPMTILGCFILGVWLDSTFQKDYFTFYLFFIGILSGALQTLEGIRKLLKDQSTTKKLNDPPPKD